MTEPMSPEKIELFNLVLDGLEQGVDTFTVLVEAMQKEGILDDKTAAEFKRKFQAMKERY